MRARETDLAEYVANNEVRGHIKHLWLQRVDGGPVLVAAVRLAAIRFMAILLTAIFLAAHSHVNPGKTS